MGSEVPLELEGFVQPIPLWVLVVPERLRLSLKGFASPFQAFLLLHSPLAAVAYLGP